MNILYKLAPEERSQWGEGLTIYYGFHDGPVGRMLIARTGNFLCWLGIHSSVDELINDFPAAKFFEDENATEALVNEIFRSWRLNRPPFLHVMLYGTEFQHMVWQALLDIPPGQMVSYGELAAAIGKPDAARAVGSAVGANPVSLLIPCHRVVNAKGDLHGYRWGIETKRDLLDHERQAA